MILVVDDDVDTREAYTGFLEVAGFTVEAAASAEEAMDLARAKSPRAILLDVTLGGTSGIELRRRLLDDPATRAIPVLAVTGHDLEAAERALFSRYLRKPIDLEAVVTWLKSLPAA